MSSHALSPDLCEDDLYEGDLSKTTGLRMDRSSVYRFLAALDAMILPFGGAAILQSSSPQ
jgi:hypothetical protein